MRMIARVHPPTLPRRWEMRRGRQGRDAERRRGNEGLFERMRHDMATGRGQRPLNRPRPEERAWYAGSATPVLRARVSKDGAAPAARADREPPAVPLFFIVICGGCALLVPAAAQFRPSPHCILLLFTMAAARGGPARKPRQGSSPAPRLGLAFNYNNSQSSEEHRDARWSVAPLAVPQGRHAPWRE
jgi:hypothetical protein